MEDSSLLFTPWISHRMEECDKKRKMMNKGGVLEGRIKEEEENASSEK